MKRLSIAWVALCCFCAIGAHADPVGSATFVISSDAGPGFSQFQVDDEGGKLIGVGGADIYLERQNGGYKGFDFARPLDMTCNATECVDNGSTQMQLEVSAINGGYKIGGTLDYVSVEASVTDSAISISLLGGSSDISLSLNRQADGSYSGSGIGNSGTSFIANLSDLGSLAGLKDPASFVAVVISPLIRN